ncbi:3-dehydroquinate synthase [Prosthecochloris sp. SCSIO W1103]|uniref:3-dehydroquinate synthase n=1 Tax=Prosthecochloris sp. SCSIO W1103 TaxID=2992244 RepID=UPI00223D40F2|nr:3-dehydroquinate synthase [Prosthecochloris sp. SCSIO W1103]UZJ36734.1 3-dehydroquinate synthase [Prosthecochloris sp. SCSIO W1103]
MSEIIVSTPVHNRLEQLFLKHNLSKKTVVLFDENTKELFGRDILTALKNQGFTFVELVVPARETSKSFRTAYRLYGNLIEADVDRSWNLLAVGGGVVGDLGGYIAASYYRGIPIVQLPTTLLAMTDSSIGGKVAINHPLGKNLIGFFHMPELVLIDPSYLKSLPEREVYAGMAEVVKYGFIADMEFLRYIEKHFDDIVAIKDPYVSEAVRKSASIKADIVEQDFKEQSGLRATLNFGHTFAHGFEKLADYRHIRHGEAVAVGMICALHLSRKLEKISQDELQRGLAILSKFKFRRGLVQKRFKNIPAETILESMLSDKKKVDKQLRYVLLEGLGKAYLHPEPLDDGIVIEAIEKAKKCC